MIQYQKVTHEGRGKKEAPKEEATALRVWLNGEPVQLAIDYDRLEIYSPNLDMQPIALSTGGVNVIQVSVVSRKNI